MKQEKLKVKKEGVYARLVNAKGEKLATHSSENGKMCGATIHFDFLMAHLPVRKYRVKIYEQFFEYEVSATDKLHAELIAVDHHNGGNYENINKTEIEEIKRQRD
jgi:archaeosine-15-forming tRNA-guanine transglycosylase